LFKASLDKTSATPYLKNKTTPQKNLKRIGGMALEVEHLPSKHELLSPIPRIAKTKQNQKKKKIKTNQPTNK
jgi:hypothetical protein